jgi:hypothetical protein
MEAQMVMRGEKWCVQPVEFEPDTSVAGIVQAVAGAGDREGDRQ